MMLADVARVALAEVVEDLVVHRVELPADLLDLLGGEAVRAGSRSDRGASWFLIRVLRSKFDFDGALGGVDAGANDLALVPETLPVRRSRTWPGSSVPTQVWQMPSRQPKGSSSPASSPATRIGVMPSLLGVAVALAEADRAALALLGRWPMIGWKRSMCRRSRSPCASQCSVIASSISPGPERNASRSRQSGQSSSRSCGRHPALLAGELLVQAEARVAPAELAQLRRRRSRPRGCAPSGSARRRRARPGGRGCAACS